MEEKTSEKHEESAKTHLTHFHRSSYPRRTDTPPKAQRACVIVWQPCAMAERARRGDEGMAGTHRHSILPEGPASFLHRTSHSSSICLTMHGANACARCG